MSDRGIGVVQQQKRLEPLLLIAVILGVVVLPVAVWLDLRNLSERLIRLQASETSRIIDDMRGFYASAVVSKILAAKGGPISATHNFRTTPGGVPIPATLSIELGKLISSHGGDVAYRFVSDLPFKGRENHHLDTFEQSALAQLRSQPKSQISEITGSIFDRQVRTATPVVMGQICVNCHNSSPDSPKRDWKVGDVRGIQEITVRQPVGHNIFVFKYLLTYMVLAALAGASFIFMQRRQAKLISGMNDELTHANSFLASISMKIAKYLSPQIYKSIFSGEKDVVIATERKKLTIFFSDIKDFTETTERLQPEDLTALLNEYFTEMSAIAEAHGGTVDKFIGDAMLIFFGDPDTKGVVGDAHACVTMAAAMQRRLERLNLQWRKRGIENPFMARIGINTGYCNVGNFGSETRMDYTIIGAEANLAARLQSIAAPGTIMLSYETYALVRDIVAAEPLAPIRMKGISRDVIPYAVEAVTEAAASSDIISEHSEGFDLVLDVAALDPGGLEKVKRRLTDALRAIDVRSLPVG